MADDESELEKRLASHSAYFSSLIDFIPVKYYLPVDDEEKVNKYYKNRLQKAPKQIIKEASKKAKRARLDPNQHKTVREIQQELEENEMISSSNSKKKAGKGVRAAFSVETIQSGNLEDLKSRLHARIEEFQRKRRAAPGKTEQHSRKKRSKSEVKEQNKKEKNTVPKGGEGFMKQNASPSKTILNDNGDVVFSKFDFMEKKKEPKPGSKEKKYSKLLAKAEAHKKKLETLQAEDIKKAKEFKDKHLWSQALQKAEGVKQRDDPKLLKKSMKKRDREKEKSRKQWKERIDHQKKQAEEKQKLRQKHIKERTEAKKAKKLGKGKKKHRPGF